MLLEIAVGDAYGAGFEYVDRDFIEQYHKLTVYVQHPRHKGVWPGAYTDDTQMSLAIAEAIVADDEWTPINLATRFVEAFQRDPHDGYARSFYGFLREVVDGAAFVANIRPESDKSGAAMRAAPIGVFPTITEVKRRATTQAKLTHDTPDGIRAAVAAALMAHYFLYDIGPKANLSSFIRQHAEGDWSLPWTGKVKSKGWMSVSAAITAIITQHSLSGVLRACVDFTGDVDTVAAIAMGAAAHSREITQHLPTSLVEGLENGSYGRNYIAALDAKLLARVQR